MLNISSVSSSLTSAQTALNAVTDDAVKGKHYRALPIIEQASKAITRAQTAVEKAVALSTPKPKKAAKTAKPGR